MSQRAVLSARNRAWITSFQRLKAFLGRIYKERGGIRYWIVPALLLVGGIYFSDYLDKHDVGIRPRYTIYQWLQRLSPRSPHAKRTALVMIGDQEYWGPEIMGRQPVSRRYLAKLLLALDQAEPELIALDFDLHVPETESDDDREADHTFLDAVACVATNRPVVLSVKIPDAADTQYVVTPSIYDRASLPDDVFKGHLRGFGDIRMIPVGLHLQTGEPQDSFAEAVVRAVDPESLLGFTDEGALPFGTFLGLRKFVSVPAQQALTSQAKDLQRQLRCKIVIVGASHSATGDGRGEFSDIHDTPAGPMPGAFVEANYVEALLDSRAYRHVGRLKATVLEAMLGAGVAAGFFLTLGSWTRLAIVMCLCLTAVTVGYIALQNFGSYFDFYLPVVLLTGHAIVTQILEWRAEANKAREAKKAKEEKA